MKNTKYKIIFLFIVGIVFCNESIAQQRKIIAKQTMQSNNDFIKKMNEIKGCEELNIQLTNLFGENYTIKNKKVITQLQKNIADKNASRCIRKKSLFGLYGDDYVNQLHLINN